MGEVLDMGCGERKRSLMSFRFPASGLRIALGGQRGHGPDADGDSVPDSVTATEYIAPM